MFAVKAFKIGISLVPLFLLRPAFSDNHPDFTGDWTLNSAGSRIKDAKLSSEFAKLTIVQKDASITISKSDGDTVSCSTAGKECQAKSEGKPSKVSFWFNGAKLVQMELTGHAGDHVTKRRLSLSADGKALQMEVIPITPAGELSTLAFDKE